MRDDEETHTADLHLHHQTPGAWLVSETGDEEDAFWLPRSRCVRRDAGQTDSDIWEFEMPEWLAIREGIV